MRNTAFFIAGLLVCFFIMQQCPRDEPDRHAPQETVTRDTVFVPKEVEKVVYRDKPVVRYETDTVEIASFLAMTKSDSMAIVADYLVSRYYEDTFLLDSGLWAWIKERVQGNEIQEREVGYIDKRPQMIVRETIRAAERNKLYAGANFLYSDLNLTFGPSLIFTTKKGGALHYTYLFNPEGSGRSTHLAGIYWKVSFKKKPP